MNAQEHYSMIDVARDEYETRKLIWHFTFPAWVNFDNLEKTVTMSPRYWWMTGEQMEWFYNTFFKGHEDEDSFSTPYVKYSSPKEVENCKSGIDRNIKRAPTTEGQKRKQDYTYLKSGY